MLGKQLLHYEIIEKLGEGGMGEVYRARDTKLSRDVAIKLIPEELAEDAERLKRFKREASVIAALKHPNIVTIHAIEEAEGAHFLVMELVEGRTLADHIPEDGVALDQLFGYAIPLADAIHSAHNKGIVHRDLKPTNIMVDADGRVKVLDFGLAKLFEAEAENDETVGLESQTGAGLILGTTAYMSPEQAEGKPVDQRTDIFSLGIILHQMATGSRPFVGDTRMSTLSSIIKDEPPSVTEVRGTLPVHLGRIVKRCLAKDPARRYQAALDIRNELEGLQNEVTTGFVERSEISGMAPRGSSAGRSRFIGVAIGVIVLAFVVVFATRDGEEPSSDTGNQPSRLSTNPPEPPAAPEAPESPARPMRSIAVLPFVNMSGDPDNEYFSDGLSEELLNLLSNVQGLRVAARTSSFHFKGQTGVMQEIGDRLNVATVLEGSVRRSGNRVRITAQLIKTDDGFHLWSETYDRELDDIFAIQEDIATEVVEALKLTLLGEDARRLARRPTENMNAYDAYLRGQQLLPLRNSEALEEAALQFERVIDLDPQMASAYVGRAMALLLLEEYGTRSVGENEAIVTALLEKALSLNENLGEAYAVQGLHKWRRNEQAEARAALEQSIELNPNFAMSYMWLAGLTNPGATTERRLLLSKARELDPLSPVVLVNSGEQELFENNVEKSLEFYRSAVELDPQFTAALSGLARLYRDQLGESEEAIEWQKRAVEADPGNLFRRIQLGGMYQGLGRFEESERIFKETIAIDPGFASAYRAMGFQEGSQGRLGEAARWFRQGFDREPHSAESVSNMVRISLDLDDLEAATQWTEYLQQLEHASVQARGAQFYLYIFQNELQKAAPLVQQLMNEAPSSFFADQVLLDLALGEIGTARMTTELIFPPLFEPDPVINGFNYRMATLVGIVLQKTGEDAQLQVVLAGMEAFLESLGDAERRSRFPDGEMTLAFLRADWQATLDAYERFVEAGNLRDWWMNHWPGQVEFQEDPRSNKMLAEQRMRIGKMRDALPPEILTAP